MNNDTRRIIWVFPRILLIVGPGVYEKLQVLEVSARTDIPPSLDFPDLEAFRPPRKRGQYWENDLTRQFGRKRRK